MQPEPFNDADPVMRARISRLFFDVDDTITWKGQLPEVAAAALYKAAASGLQLVAVTGRSYSWAEMLLRLFPLTAAVAETGACALVRMSGQLLDVIHTEPDVAVRRSLFVDRTAACDRALREVPTARLALDNAGRVYDCAFDLVESGPPVSSEDAARIRSILHDEGLVTAQSSVHINAWKLGPNGSFDKATMAARVLKRVGGSFEDMAYVGDSTNDGSMFAKAKLSVGVGNVRPHLAALGSSAPKYVVDGQGGHGFAQVVNALVEDR
jgi:HAD superfamily hydrolase (TIGR01484 family)